MSDIEERVHKLEGRMDSAEYHITEETRRAIDADANNFGEILKVSERLYKLEAKLKAAGIKLDE